MLRLALNRIREWEGAGEEIEACARMGSVCASFAVECYGTQEYSFSPEEFKERLLAC